MGRLARLTPVQPRTTRTTYARIVRQNATEASDEARVQNRHVLIVEDDVEVAGIEAAYLRDAGLIVSQVSDGFAALAAIQASPPDLVVLDRMLPGVDGVEICRRVRRDHGVPVILLTALGSEEDRIDGFEAGADDYLVKPFSPRELVLRVQALLRRTVDPLVASSPLRVGPFVLDSSARIAHIGDRMLDLTGREFDLLEFFVRHPAKAFSRTELLSAVWGWTVGDPSTVTVHVRRLREKIEPDVSAPTFITTVWGVGYRFDEE